MMLLDGFGIFEIIGILGRETKKFCVDPKIFGWFQKEFRSIVD
jgi:hypothetical protein